MEKEQVAVDEAVETVAEENTRAYSKTVWNESTPITADKLNKIENGIANALDRTTGGTVNGKLTVKGHIQSDGGNFYSNKNGGNKPVIEVFDGDKNGSAVVYGAGGLTVLAGGESGSAVVQNIPNAEEHAVVSADHSVKLYTNLQNGWDNRKTVELTAGGRFKLHNNSLEFSPNNSGYARMGFDENTQDVYISNINNNWFRLKGDKTITYAGNKVYTSFDKPTPAEIGAFPIAGGTLTGKIDVPGESTFYKGTYVDPWENTGCVIKASGNVGIGGSLKVNGKLEVGQDIKSPVFEARTDFVINRHGFSSFYTNNQEGAHIFCNKNSSSITLKDAKMSYDNPNGSVEIGPQNEFHCHFYTDRPTFYFNKDLSVYGNSVYHAGNKPTPAAIGAMSSSGPSFSGNMIQAGAGGRDWIYHINADAGTLHMAPHSNGNNDWDNQIMFDRSGVMYCNGRKKVPTMADQHAAHYMFRYGSGLGGANGYITFSY